MKIRLYTIFIAYFFIGLNLFAQDRSTVAILDLEALGVAPTEAIAITNMVRDELIRSARFKVLERGEMQEILSEQGFQLSGCTSSECVVQAGRILGVQRMLAGSVAKLGNMFIINLRLINVETGEVLSSANEPCKGTIEDLALTSTPNVVGKLLGIAPGSTKKIDTSIPPAGQTPEANTEGDKKFRLASLMLKDNKERALTIFDEIVNKHSDCASADDALYFLMVEEPYTFERTKERLMMLKAYYPDSPRIAEAESYIQQAHRREGDQKFLSAKQMIDTESEKALKIMCEVVRDYSDCQSADDALYYLIIKGDFKCADSLWMDMNTRFPDSPLLPQASKFILDYRDQEKEGAQKYRTASSILDTDRPQALKIMQEIADQYPNCSFADDALYDLIAYGDTHQAEDNFNRLKSSFPLSPFLPQAEKMVEDLKRERKGDEIYSNGVNLLEVDLPKALTLLKNVIDDYKKCASADDALYLLITKGDISQAEGFLQTLRSDYPESPYLTEAEKYLKEKAVFLSSDFILLPGGTFKMGNSRGESNEKPAHNVTIPTILMQKTEVTQTQWKKVMNYNPSKFSGENLPVENVTWDEVQDFIARLNRLEPGAGYRLPSESEWEFACRAGSQSRYAFGEDGKLLPKYGWSKANSNGKTHPVASLEPNAWGIYDLYGNVGEWCEDTYKLNYDGVPVDGKSFIVLNNPEKVVRGGDWDLKSDFCQSTTRYGKNRWEKSKFIGFRLVKTAK